MDSTGILQVRANHTYPSALADLVLLGLARTY